MSDPHRRLHGVKKKADPFWLAKVLLSPDLVAQINQELGGDNAITFFTALRVCHRRMMKSWTPIDAIEYLAHLASALEDDGGPKEKRIGRKASRIAKRSAALYGKTLEAQAGFDSVDTEEATKAYQDAQADIEADRGEATIQPPPKPRQSREELPAGEPPKAKQPGLDDEPRRRRRPRRTKNPGPKAPSKPKKKGKGKGKKKPRGQGN